MITIAYIFVAIIAIEIVWNALWAWTLFALWLVARLFRDRGIAVPSAIARYRH